MARINLKRLLKRNKQYAQTLQTLLSGKEKHIHIVDHREQLIWGKREDDFPNEYALKHEEEILGWIKSKEEALCIQALIQSWIDAEVEQKRLGKEVLDLYREINLIYSFSEKLATTTSPADIGNMALEEAGRLIKMDAGWVVLLQDEGQQIKHIAKTETEAASDSQDKMVVKIATEILEKGQANIINQIDTDTRFNKLNLDLHSILFAPLKVKQRVSGLILLAHQQQIEYTAAELKLLNTIALQAASAIETALLYEKNLEEARKREETLKRVDKLKDQFLANTSHELRTPLNGIIGLSESLLEKITDKKHRIDLSMIISSGKRLASLVNDILDFSKLKNHEISLLTKSIDLRSLLEIVIPIHRPSLLGKASLKLENCISPELSTVEADENRLQQIFHNLIGNSIKFTESGHVRVEAREKMNGKPENTMIEVMVSDTGIGIPKHKRDAIFQEFEQVDGSAQREFAGTGLGLSISKRLVELHGGEMWVESEVGQGTVFHFTLPVSSSNADRVRNPVSVARSTPSRVDVRNFASKTGKIQIPINSQRLTPNFETSTVNILIVDDEPINQQVLKNHLENENYHIQSAMNGTEALKLLNDYPHFDMILLDVMMPRMSGYEVCQKIREQYLPSELPVIMVTAKDQTHELVEGFSLGANDYLSKPFSKAEFLARLKTHLNLHQINRTTRRFVPQAFLRALGKESIVDTQLGDQRSQEVTVLFTDIRDYTSLSESMTPEENFRFVNAYAGRMGPIIQSNGGFVHQYLGDGIMAIFQNSPEDALKAALRMQETLVIYNQERISQERRPIKVGMGLHTGPLVMGIIGDQYRTEAATISDTVNTASRMEGLTKDFVANILISEESYRGISNKDDFNFRYLGKVNVKGKQKAIGVYECVEGEE